MYLSITIYWPEPEYPIHPNGQSAKAASPIQPMVLPGPIAREACL